VRRPYGARHDRGARGGEVQTHVACVAAVASEGGR